MNTKVIDGITIYIENGKKYRKSPAGHMYPLCREEACTRRVQHECGGYCSSHYSSLDEEERKKIQKAYADKEKQKTDRQCTLEKSKVTIDGIDIYTLDSKKYRIDVRGQMVPACSYDNCNKFADNNCARIYCQAHKDGTDPNSESRKAELIAKRKASTKDNFKTGDASEQWVAEKLRSIKSITDVDIVGFTGSKYDIEFKLIGEEDVRGIQVRTLSKHCRAEDGDSYKLVINNTNYTDKVLFIGVNKERNRFAVIYYGDILEHVRSFNFKNDKSPYVNNMFTDCNEFMKKLENMLKKTAICDSDCRPKKIQGEYESLSRLKIKCQENRLTYSRVTESASKIDCIINDYAIQHKSSQTLSGNYYQFAITKANGAKKTKIPYSTNDGIEFFVFEIVNFKNNFYIVPIDIMISMGYIKTNKQNGKTSLGIPNPENNDKSHWMNKYLNNFDLLKPKRSYNATSV